MTRIKITEIGSSDDVAAGKVNATFDSWATTSSSIDTENIREEAFGRRSLDNNAVVPAIYWYADGGDTTYSFKGPPFNAIPSFQVPERLGTSSGIDLTIDNFDCAIVRTSFEYAMDRDGNAPLPYLLVALAYATDGPTSSSWTYIEETVRIVKYHTCIADASSSTATGGAFELNEDGAILRGSMTIAHRFTSADSSTYAFGVLTTLIDAPTAYVMDHTISHQTITVEVFTR
jgi:hypothetical protein